MQRTHTRTHAYASHRRDTWDYSLDYAGRTHHAPAFGDWEDEDGAWEEPPHGMDPKRRVLCGRVV